MVSVLGTNFLSLNQVFMWFIMHFFFFGIYNALLYSTILFIYLGRMTYSVKIKDTGVAPLFYITSFDTSACNKTRKKHY